MTGLLRENKLTMREIDVVFDPERKLFLYFAVVLIAIGVGPFGTYYAMTFSQRAIFWALDVLGGMAILVPVLHVFYFSALAAWIPSWPRFFIGVALGALPTAGYITVLYGTIGAALPISPTFPQLYLEVTVFSSILLLVEFMVWPAIFSGADRQPAPAMAQRPNWSAKPARPALLDRLPPEFRDSEVVSISMQDHYAEITTTKGKTLLLIRLGDAIDLLPDVPGLQIHRSHWVARAYAEGIEKTGRRTELVLSDGRRLPIGNTYLMAVRGWLGAPEDRRAT
jgi:hypothetical protein